MGKVVVIVEAACADDDELAVGRADGLLGTTAPDCTVPAVVVPLLQLAMRQASFLSRRGGARRVCQVVLQCN